jgi:hypothetical protein
MPSACAGASPLGAITTAGGLCLGAAAGSTAGTPVQVQSCAGNAAQTWQVIPSSGGSAQTAIINPATRLCVDISGGSTAAGSKLQLYTCNGSGAQQWAVPAQTGALTSGLGANICAASSGAAATQVVTQNPCSTSQWRFTSSA